MLGENFNYSKFFTKRYNFYIFYFRKYLRNYTKWLKDMTCGSRRKIQNDPIQEIVEMATEVDKAIVADGKMINEDL